jgi:hypothetical protein
MLVLLVGVFRPTLDDLLEQADAAAHHSHLASFAALAVPPLPFGFSLFHYLHQREKGFG